MLRKTLGLALSLIGAFNFSLSNAMALEVTVSPPRFEVEIDGKKRSQSITISNLSNKPVEMKAYVRNWTMSEDNQVQEINSTEKSLDQWITFTPSRFVIPANRSQTIRFAIRPKVQPSAGEHRAVLYLEEVTPNNQNSQALTTYARIGVVIYANAGDVKRVGVLNSVSVDAKPDSAKAIFDISSRGNAHVRMKGQYAIWPAAKYPGASATKALQNVNNPQANILEMGVLQLSPVLPGSNRKLMLPFTKNLPPGNYVLDINADLSGTPIDKGIPFTVPAKTSTTQPQQPANQTVKPTGQITATPGAK